MDYGGLPEDLLQEAVWEHGMSGEPEGRCPVCWQDEDIAVSAASGAPASQPAGAPGEARKKSSWR